MVENFFVKLLQGYKTLWTRFLKPKFFAKRSRTKHYYKSICLNNVNIVVSDKIITVIMMTQWRVLGGLLESHLWCYFEGDIQGGTEISLQGGTFGKGGSFSWERTGGGTFKLGGIGLLKGGAPTLDGTMLYPNLCPKQPKNITLPPFGFGSEEYGQRHELSMKRNCTTMNL